ncbi:MULTISPECIES: hypothetical protein [unclassified Caballeronia]|uniref:hypothetical protein n=1 Tax=unclassified Caballeronia TaxID=2646786 RepID=UPI0038579AD3
MRLTGTKPVHVDIERVGDSPECVKWRHRNASPPELDVVFASVDPFGRFGGTDVGALHGAVEARGDCAPQYVVFVTAFQVSDGSGMSAHSASTLSIYIFAVQRRLIFAHVGIIRSHDDEAVTRGIQSALRYETAGRILSKRGDQRQVGKQRTNAIYVKCLPAY